MRKDPYSTTIPYGAKKAAQDAEKKIVEECQAVRPDMYKINKLREMQYMPGLFDDVYSNYIRFRNPW
jgi:hypothetical protein